MYYIIGKHIKKRRLFYITCRYLVLAEGETKHIFVSKDGKIERHGKRLFSIFQKIDKEKFKEIWQANQIFKENKSVDKSLEPVDFCDLIVAKDITTIEEEI